ncbi:helix-turn-helix domain-containing protein [Devosia psychrophila]|uniref:DNA-binding protein n=1 Tax=Devosia psychrophila TaxID=728005 RepID=A0A0F5PW84_9HYPH|nr:helix-turn-helix transcriptional regulator [Devosia psychrophila]KKC32651.1 DNA-binding protein [Devosia psychrophila]SFC51122.1 hypothetical protein SAMN04488059_10660 [Devosia psychrophila]
MRKSIRSKRHEMVAQAIGEQRIRAGFTQYEVARRLDRHQPFMANIESGDRRIDVVELLDIAEIIDLDVPALIGRLRATR